MRTYTTHPPIRSAAFSAAFMATLFLDAFIAGARFSNYEPRPNLSSALISIWTIYRWVLGIRCRKRLTKIALTAPRYVSLVASSMSGGLPGWLLATAYSLQPLPRHQQILLRGSTYYCGTSWMNGSEWVRGTHHVSLEASTTAGRVG